MKLAKSFKNIYRGMGDSIERFPLTLVLLVMAAILNSMMIENNQADFMDYMYTLLVGAALGAVGQVIYERFFKKTSIRYLIMAGVLVLALGYYFLINADSPFDSIAAIKTMVSLFALVIAFIWIPAIDNENVQFYHSFLSAFKAFFTTIAFAGILMLGISAIFYATDYLLFAIDDALLSHLLNYIGFLFAPMYFLSMTPNFSKRKTSSANNNSPQAAEWAQPFSVPRFLEVLLSYIVIPLIIIYTLILLAYVALNFTEDFWTDNLLEPLLVSYAVIVIIVLILSYNIDNQFANLFRKIFPKILLPIVVFQTIASVLKIQEMGITHGRYYVIMFGVFATIAAILFSFIPAKYHGWLAALLLLLSLISIVPPVDAFTTSRRTQINLLEERLVENDMLSNNEIVRNSNVPEEDKIAITQAAVYIEQMGYHADVPYWPKDLEVYNNFNHIFGFHLTYPGQMPAQYPGEYAFLNEAADSFLINIENSDIMLVRNLYHIFGETGDDIDRIRFEAEGAAYYIDDELLNDYHTLFIRDEENNELIRLNSAVIFDHIFQASDDAANSFVPLNVEDATYESENEHLSMKIIVNSIERNPDYYHVNFYWLIDIK